LLVYAAHRDGIVATPRANVVGVGTGTHVGSVRGAGPPSGWRSRSRASPAPAPRRHHNEGRAIEALGGADDADLDRGLAAGRTKPAPAVLLPARYGYSFDR